MLGELYDGLLPVIRDSKLNQSSPAFRTFFEDSANAPFVTSLLTNVTEGVAMTSPTDTVSPNGSPVFFCVDGENQFTYLSTDPSTGVKLRYDTYKLCLEAVTNPAMYIGFDNPKQFIVICPVFWSNTIDSYPPPDTCLSVSRYTNKYRENGQRQRLFRMWILLEELAHYYIYTSTLRKDAPDIYNVNECARLPAETAYLNAISYVYYAASKLSSTKQK